MKIAYVESDGKIREILPEGISLNNIAKWYNEKFALHCVEVPDNLNANDYTENAYIPPESVIQEIINGI